MISCDFSKRAGKSLTTVLYETIKAQILGGTLRANEKLPSKRALAEHLGVSIITVQNAYENLIGEGYIFSIEKRGFFVEDLTNVGAGISALRGAAPSAAAQNATAANDSPCIDSPQTPRYKYDFTQNIIDFEKFPFAAWAKISKKVLLESKERLLKPQPATGCAELKRAIAAHLRNFKNMAVAPEQIVVGAGTEVLYNFLYQLLGDKRYALENPGYTKIRTVLRNLGAAITPVPLDADGISIGELEKSGASVVHVTPSHHFPTGIVMPVKRRFELLEWARRVPGRFIIEDDYDSEFRFAGKIIEPLFNSGESGQVIYINTFSKTLSPSFRISFLVLPPRLLTLFTRKFGEYSCTVSSIEQLTLARFIDEGHFARHIIKMKNHYRTIRNYFILALKNSPFAGKIEILEKDSGLHFLLKIDSAQSSAQLRSSLQQNGVNIALLNDFYYTPAAEAENALVVNYSGIKLENIGEVVQLLAATV